MHADSGDHGINVSIAYQNYVTLHENMHVWRAHANCACHVGIVDAALQLSAIRQRLQAFGLNVHHSTLLSSALLTIITTSYAMPVPLVTRKSRVVASDSKHLVCRCISCSMRFSIDTCTDCGTDQPFAAQKQSQVG